MGQACSLCSPPDKPCDVKLLDCERLGAAPGKPFAAVADTAADGMATPASARTECSDWTAPPTPARDGLDEAGAPAAGAPVDAVNALSAAAEPPAADAGAPAERVPEDGARDAPAAAPPAVAAANAPAAELPAPPPPPLKPKRTIAWSAYAWDDMFTPTLSWVAEATGSALPADALDARAAHAFLRSGEVLCALANALQPGIVSAVDHAHAPFAHRENIARFLTAAERLGVAGHETFQTHDLYDGTDMKQVIAHAPPRVRLRRRQRCGAAARVVPSGLPSARARRGCAAAPPPNTHTHPHLSPLLRPRRCAFASLRSAARATGWSGSTAPRSTSRCAPNSVRTSSQRTSCARAPACGGRPPASIGRSAPLTVGSCARRLRRVTSRQARRRSPSSAACP